MLKERIDEVYQSNRRYIMTQYYRGFKTNNNSTQFLGMKSGIYRGVKWDEATTSKNKDNKRTKNTNTTTKKQKT